jgi:hypothetical protein
MPIRQSQSGVGFYAIQLIFLSLIPLSVMPVFTGRIKLGILHLILFFICILFSFLWCERIFISAKKISIAIGWFGNLNNAAEISFSDITQLRYSILYSNIFLNNVYSVTIFYGNGKKFKIAHLPLFKNHKDLLREMVIRLFEHQKSNIIDKEILQDLDFHDHSIELSNE